MLVVCVRILFLEGVFFDVGETSLALASFISRAAIPFSVSSGPNRNGTLFHPSEDVFVVLYFSLCVGLRGPPQPRLQRADWFLQLRWPAGALPEHVVVVCRASTAPRAVRWEWRTDGLDHGHR